MYERPSRRGILPTVATSEHLYLELEIPHEAGTFHTAKGFNLRVTEADLREIDAKQDGDAILTVQAGIPYQIVGVRPSEIELG